MHSEVVFSRYILSYVKNSDPVYKNSEKIPKTGNPRITPRSSEGMRDISKCSSNDDYFVFFIKPTSGSHPSGDRL